MRRQSGFTLVELLVVMVIIGTLASLLLPAVQSAREAGRMTVCKTNLKQVGLACLTFASMHGGLPAASTEPSWITNPVTYGDSPRIGWVWSILPYLEQTNISSQYDPTIAWFASTNGTLAANRLSLMECPTDTIAGYAIHGTDTDPLSGSSVSFTAAACDYFAIVALNSNVSQVGFNPRQDETYTSTDGSNYSYLGAFQDDQLTPLAKIRDGTSNTMMLSEMSGRPKAYVTGGVLNPNIADKTYGYGAWAHNDKHVVSTYTYDGLTSPGTCPLNCSNQYAVYSFHPAGANGAFADGSVHCLSQNIDLLVFLALVTRAGGEIISGGALNDPN